MAGRSDQRKWVSWAADGPDGGAAGWAGNSPGGTVGPAGLIWAWPRARTIGGRAKAAAAMTATDRTDRTARSLRSRRPRSSSGLTGGSMSSGQLGGQGQQRADLLLIGHGVLLRGRAGRPGAGWPARGRRGSSRFPARSRAAARSPPRSGRRDSAERAPPAGPRAAPRVPGARRERGRPGRRSAAGLVARAREPPGGDLAGPAPLPRPQREPDQRPAGVGLGVGWVAQPSPGQVRPDQRGLGEILGVTAVADQQQPGPHQRAVARGHERGELVVPRQRALPSTQLEASAPAQGSVPRLTEL